MIFPILILGILERNDCLESGHSPASPTGVRDCSMNCKGKFVWTSKVGRGSGPGQTIEFSDSDEGENIRGGGNAASHPNGGGRELC